MISSLPLFLDMHPFNKKNPPSSSSSSSLPDREPQPQQQQARGNTRGGPNTNNLHVSTLSTTAGMRGGSVPPSRNRAELPRQVDLVTSQAQSLASELQQLQQLQLLQQQHQQQQQQQQAYLRGAFTHPAPLAFGSFPMGMGRIDTAAAVAAAMSSLLNDAARANHNLVQQRQQQHERQQRLLLWERQAAIGSYLRQPQNQQPLLQQLLQLQQMQQQHPLPSPLRMQAALSAASGTPPLGAAASPAAPPATAFSENRGATGPPAATKDPTKTRKDSIATAASASGEARSAAASSSSGDGRRFPSERAALADEVSGRCPSPRTATKVLQAIGTTLRSKADTFVDVSNFPLQQINMNEKRRGASVFFPEILHRLLAEAERDGGSNIVGWLPHHRAFRVHNKPRFEKEILPRYFVGQTKVRRTGGGLT
jgi:hypothetical protein